MARQPYNFTTNHHQVFAEAKVKKMQESTSMTNHDPRMNRISSNVLVELPQKVASIRRSLVPEVPHVLVMIV
jgi:hypothetical protein